MLRIELLLFYVLTLFAAGAWALPDYQAVRAAYQSSEGQLLDRHGAVIHELRTEARGRRLHWAPLNEISPALLQAVIGAEDHRFYAHGGVDWRAVVGAVWHNFRHRERRGASTISMQLGSLLDPSLKPRAGRRGLAEKWRQGRAAMAIERLWSKQEILEAYLNLSSFRGELQGVTAVSRALFGKDPSGIAGAEALLLAALLRSPNAEAGAVARRACRLGLGFAVSCAGIQLRAQSALAGGYSVRPAVELAPHVARLLLKPGVARVVSTLDAGLQARAREALSHQLAGLAERGVRDGAVLVVDNASGEVLAYVGNSGPSASAPYVDGVRAPRQAGSTLKPFLYELALEQRLLTAASVLDDSPVNLTTPNGLYVPQNYDREFKGLVSLRSSLAGSLNVPAVRVLMLLGVDAFLERLNRLGFEGLIQPADYYGYSLALGSAEVSLWQLVGAYRTLATGGLGGELSLSHTKPQRPRLMDETAAFIVSDILSDRSARSLSFGLENPLSTPRWSAVKTGTSKDMRDNWCIGYSERHTVGVWVGNFSGEPMREVSGVSGAAPVWFEIMNYLYQSEPTGAPHAPKAAVRAPIVFQPPIEPPRREWFLSGTESSQIRLATSSRDTARITYPGDGTVLALDPDIPPARQRVFFSMHPADPSLHWCLDGRRVAQGWKPLGGSHVLSLSDPQGKALDRVSFVVRGTETRH